MSKPISVGIIIPVYKIPYEMLHECFKSMQKQTYENISFLFIDDASPDNCGKICEELAVQDKRISVIHNEKNLGVSKTRNIGIETLKTDYITFVDADDWLDDNTINRIVEWMNFQQKRYDIVMYRELMSYPNMDIADDYINNEAVFWNTKEERDELQITAISSAVKGYKSCAVSIDNVAGKLISKELLEKYKIRFKLIPYREDGVFFQEIVEYSNRIAAVPIGYYHYRMRIGSAVNQFRPNCPQEQLDLCSCMWDFAKKNKKNVVYMERLYYFLLIPIQMAISTYYYHPLYKCGLFNRHKQCRDYLKQKPYSDMSRHIKFGKLKRNAAVKYIMLRMHLYWGINVLRRLYYRKINCYRN